MIELAERTPLHLPDLHTFEDNGLTYARAGYACCGPEGCC